MICVLIPGVSLTSMAMLPGVIISFSSISSRSSTSTRIGSLAALTPERVAWTTISSASDSAPVSGLSCAEAAGEMAKESSAANAIDDPEYFARPTLTPSSKLP